MKYIRRLLVGSLLAFLLACQAEKENSSSVSVEDGQTAVTSTGEIFQLSALELKQQEALAKQGDFKAAMRVAEHYSLTVNDTEASIPWLRIAAEGGDVAAMQNLGASLVEIGGIDNCEEAIQWFLRLQERAADSHAREFAVEDSVRSLKSNWSQCVARGSKRQQ